MINWPENVSILIPSYKSAHLIKKFIPDLLKIVPSKNICVVDDASNDNTDQICDSFGITCLKHTVNKGKGAALDTGFRYLINQDFSWLITMDADGQHAPRDLENFLTLIRNNPEMGIGIGKRCMKPGVMPLARICSNVITSKLLSIFTGSKILDSQCGYRVYSADFIKLINIQFNRFEMESEVILKAAHHHFPICFTDVQTLYLDGFSHISHFKDTIRWVKAVLVIWHSLGKKQS
ncbi:MAG: glycosyltransferase family 2 protein [Fibrobacter sp.]|nr:glycosyltransferase family 2 protein [Fibrobacter sp.]